MKIAIYSPYLDTIGGGERYMLTIAETLASDHQVDVLLDNHLSSLDINLLKETLSKRLNLDLKAVNFIKAPLGSDSKALNRSLFLRKYDVLFCLTDGSIFYSTARKSILHIQSPLTNNQKTKLKNKIKLSSWDLIIYNSEFTKKHAEKSWPIKSQVIYPPVDLSGIKPLTKKNYILSVGRFFGYLREKKHEVLIRSFIEMYQKNNLKGWSLHLVGSATSGDTKYLNELTKMAEGFPIYLYPNLNYQKLLKLYGQSSIYWHGAGFEETDPTKMEHFGITTVEAMAGGCVPVVIGQGGQTEIIQDKTDGFLWKDLDELNKLTLKIIEDKTLRQRMTKQAIIRAKTFSKDKFEDRIREVIK